MIDDLLPTFQCRGGGTDLVPPHLSQIYSQHVDEATKRESLSALALAITPRWQELLFIQQDEGY